MRQKQACHHRHRYMNAMDIVHLIELLSQEWELKMLLRSYIHHVWAESESYEDAKVSGFHVRNKIMQHPVVDYLICLIGPCGVQQQQQ